MSSRTVTLAGAALLVVVLAAVAALLPVPYVVESPGPTTNTLGRVGTTTLILIEGRKTYPTDGRLDLTTVSVRGGPGNKIDLFTAIDAWIDDEAAVVPEEEVYPKGDSAEEIEQESVADMRRSQTSASTAALRHLRIPVQVRLVVDQLAEKTQAKGKLQPGDVIVEVEGERVDGGARLRDIITSRKAGSNLTFAVQRDGKRLRTTIKTAPSPEDGRPIIGILTRDDPTYPFKVEIKLDDVGGPSAGLMFALGIVDKLTPGPLTAGRHVAGTGTIDDTGQVGPIGGIPQKMVGARDAGATVFLVPPENCAEAVATAPSGLRLVKAATLKAAVGALDALRLGSGNIPSCAR
jgi:PDZ domain-containing protein